VFTTPAVLLLLAEGPSHGYQLLSRLPSMLPSEAAPPDASGLYRLLRGLESAGSVHSSWTSSGRGPARRVYELTDSGRDTLDRWGAWIVGEMQALSGLLAAYYDASSSRRPRAE
jgi:DNA-binding PadR family transcriptional regulator